MSRLPAKPVAALLAAGALLLLAMPSAWARSSDRSQAMDIESGSSSGGLDDRHPTVFSQGVTITQGTLNIQATTATVTTRGGEPVRAVFVGGPVKLSQQLDDGTPMSATAGRVDYDLTTEVVVFSDSVKVTQPRGSLSGPRVVYNMKTGMVNSSSDSSGRVKMRILPKGGAAAKPADAPKKGTN